MNLWNPINRHNIRQSILALGDWYYPLHLGAGVCTRPINRETIAQWVRCERGFRKMDRFIKPIFSFRNKSVLEIGTNCGGNLLWCWHQGAKACVGIESEEKYFNQSWFVKQFFTSKYKQDIPLTIYWGLAEDLAPVRYYARIYDVGLMLSVIYHIPEQYRVDVLKNAVNLCNQVILQGNGLEDTGNGRGYDSLMKIIDAADVTVYTLKREKHVRGLVVVVGK